MTNSLLRSRNAFLKNQPEETMLVRGRKWGVLRAGNNGPALLMLPGTLGRAGIFWQQIDALKLRARILAVNYPATHDLDEWAGDIVLLMTRFGFGKATVMGSSLGGYLAQYLAGKYPERVEGLIAANTLSSTEGLVGKQPYTSDLANLPIEVLRAGFMAGLKQREETRSFEKELYPLLYGEVQGGIPARNLRARLMALKHAPPIPDIRLGPENITTIESDDDPLIIPEVRKGVRKFLSPSTAYCFRTGGHFPYVTQPDAYLSIIEEHLGLARTGHDWGTGPERVT